MLRCILLARMWHECEGIHWKQSSTEWPVEMNWEKWVGDGFVKSWCNVLPMWKVNVVLSWIDAAPIKIKISYLFSPLQHSCLCCVTAFLIFLFSLSWCCFSELELHFLLQVKCTLFVTGIPKNAKEETVQGHFT